MSYKNRQRRRVSRAVRRIFKQMMFRFYTRPLKMRMLDPERGVKLEDFG